MCSLDYLKKKSNNSGLMNQKHPWGITIETCDKLYLLTCAARIVHDRNCKKKSIESNACTAFL